jgi:hypothetical protein
MLKSVAWGGLATVALLAAAPAAASGYYFNKPGVSRDTYMADVAECMELAGGVRPANISTPYSPNIYAAGAVAFFAGIMRSRERRRLSSAVERTCMADKGYARYQIGNALLREIRDISDEEQRMDRLFGLAASDAPIGTRMPE